MNAELPERPIVFRADVGAENKIGICGAMQPPIVLNLMLELSRRPGNHAGITTEPTATSSPSWIVRVSAAAQVARGVTTVEEVLGVLPAE